MRGDFVIKIALLDDNKMIHNKIINTLVFSHEMKDLDLLVETFSSISDFLAFPNNKDFTILILDIELSGSSGLDFSKTMSVSHKDTYIIFLTSFEHYMKDAFGLNVHQYILKSEMSKKLPKSVKKLLRTLENDKYKLISFKSNQNSVVVKEEDIQCVVFEERRPVLYLDNGKRIFATGINLTGVYDKLDKTKFIKANHGTIINVKYIKSYTRDIVRLENINFDIKISRGRRGEIIESLKEYEHYRVEKSL